MSIKGLAMSLILMTGISASYVSMAETTANASTDQSVFVGGADTTKFDSLNDENWWKVDHWGGGCLRDGAPCHDNPGACCSGRCNYVHHGTDYCDYSGGGGWGGGHGGGGWGGGHGGGGWGGGHGGGGWGGGWNCLRAGTPCHRSATPCCTHCVVVNHGTDYCAY